MNEALDFINELTELLKSKNREIQKWRLRYQEMVKLVSELPQNASALPRGEHEPSLGGGSRNNEHESTCEPIELGGVGVAFCISEIHWEYEDQPPALSDAEFTQLFIASRTIDGVRVYPFTQDHKGHRTWISTPYQP